MKISKEIRAIVNDAVKAEKKCIGYYVEHQAYVEGDTTYANFVGASDAYKFVIETLGLEDAYHERYFNTDRYGNEMEEK